MSQGLARYGFTIPLAIDVKEKRSPPGATHLFAIPILCVSYINCVPEPKRYHVRQLTKKRTAEGYLVHSFGSATKCIKTPRGDIIPHGFWSERTCPQVKPARQNKHRIKKEKSD
jgi:hypothetical protein